LDRPESGSEPVCHTWGAFSGNDTIALEGNYVAAEHQGMTRIWDWKRKLFSAYRWDLSLSLHPHDHIEDGNERIDITIRPPYVYLIHSRLRLFAAFRIPVMQDLDVFADLPHWHTLDDDEHPVVPFVRPEIVLDLTAPYSIYNTLELACPEGERFAYEEMRLSNITGVQFINPWSLQMDTPSENAIPFFITVSNSNGSRAYLMRYDVSQSWRGRDVNRPLLKQIIETSSPSLDIVSPTVVTDDFGSFWGTEGGLLYAVDSRTPEIDKNESVYSMDSMDDLESILPDPLPARMIVHEGSAHSMRHRVGYDVISGRKFKVLRSQIVISDFVPRAQLSFNPPLSSDILVDEA